MLAPKQLGTKCILLAPNAVQIAVANIILVYFQVDTLKLFSFRLLQYLAQNLRASQYLGDQNFLENMLILGLYSDVFS